MSPTLTVTTAPTRRSIYVSFSPAVSVTPWLLRYMYTLTCSIYSGILICSCASFTTEHSTEQQGQSELLVFFHEDCRQRQVGECRDTWYKQIKPTKTSGAVAAQKLANAPVWIRNDRWAAVFVTFISTQAQHYTYYSAHILFVDVELHSVNISLAMLVM